jgi:MFS family permease
VRDRGRLYATAFLRALATGMIGVLLGVYLATLRLDPAAIGLVVAAGLAGGALATLAVTLAGDRLGRRRTLVALALLGAAGGLALATASTAAAVTAASLLGMVNGMGRDRGASMVLEQAVLPATTTDAGRTRAFAWYNVLQDAGHALGGLLAALPAVAREVAGAGEVPSLRLAVALYAVLLAATAALYGTLSPAVERAVEERRVPVSPETRRIVRRISALFALDSLGGGFLTTALLSLFFHARFGAGVETLGPLFFVARVANALSHLGAAWLAARIGLVNTMVFTHVPSSLLLVTVAFAPSFPIAAALFVLREGLVEMDVPTRQSYVMAVVRPAERTFASGVTNLVRTGGWAIAPAFAGLFMQGLALGTPLIAGAAMKIAYDVLLYRAFRGLPPPEERRDGT